jgi:hypothetical protein
MGWIFDKKKILHQDILDHVTVALVTGWVFDKKKVLNEGILWRD